jgi:hypothetical protein
VKDAAICTPTFKSDMPVMLVVVLHQGQGIPNFLSYGTGRQELAYQLVGKVQHSYFLNLKIKKQQVRRNNFHSENFSMLLFRDLELFQNLV